MLVLATGAYNSNFLVTKLGIKQQVHSFQIRVLVTSATNASYSNFIGQSAGVFIGAIIQISFGFIAGLEQQMPHAQISLELKLVITQQVNLIQISLVRMLVIRSNKCFWFLWFPSWLFSNKCC
jgi:hypothetical protein